MTQERRDRAHFEPFFSFEHLPESLREVSEPFAQLFELVVFNLPQNAETTTCCRKLLEAKDCAVRAQLIANLAKTEGPTPDGGS